MHAFFIPFPPNPKTRGQTTPRQIHANLLSESRISQAEQIIIADITHDESMPVANIIIEVLGMMRKDLANVQTFKTVEIGDLERDDTFTSIGLDTL